MKLIQVNIECRGEDIKHILKRVEDFQRLLDMDYEEDVLKWPAEVDTKHV